MLHVMFSDVAGHAAPPLADGVTIVRLLVCSPPPQAAEQSLQSDQLDTMQSTTAQGKQQSTRQHTGLDQRHLPV
jgi:hypothetical protein